MVLRFVIFLEIFTTQTIDGLNLIIIKEILSKAFRPSSKEVTDLKLISNYIMHDFEPYTNSYKNFIIK